MKRKEYAWAYLFVSAPILGFLLFAFVPLSYSVYVSFTEYSGYQPRIHGNCELRQARAERRAVLEDDVQYVLLGA